MMNIEKSGWAGKSRAAVALVLVLVVGTMTAQSNAVLDDVPVTEVNPVAKANSLEIQFSIDDISLSEGLQFSKVRDYKGAFKFEFGNEKADHMHIGLDLVRKGSVIARMSQKIEERVAFDIRPLLSKAEREDYLVIDIIEGPSEVVKLYNIPLFKESKARAGRQVSDLPPPPVALFLDGTAIAPQHGVLLSALKAADSQIEYEISEFVDFGVVNRQGGKVKASLLREKEIILTVSGTDIKRKDSIALKELLSLAKEGDEIIVQFGKSDGLSFGSKFPIK